TDLENDLDDKQAKVITGTSATGNTTAEKVVTAASNPAAGDLLAVTYSNGVNVNYPTLTVNGAATADVLCGGYAATSGMTTAVPGATILYWFDGTSYHMMAASSNTQYGEISETEIDEGTSATGRTITGRRTEYLMAHEATKTRTLTGKTIDGRDNTITNLGIEAVDFVVDEDNMASNSSTQVPTQQSVKAYV